MVVWTYMTKYPLPSPAVDQLNDQPALELPTDPDFVSRPPQIDHQAMLQRIAENMSWRKNRPGEAERRTADGIPVEFVL
jgi:hypothetical protein